MTVATATNKAVLPGNGLTTVFSYNFRIDSAGDVQVIYTDALGISTTLTSSQYTISGLLSPSGGTVTYPLVGSPIASGTSLTILRELPLTQAVSISNQGAFYPESVELAIDRAVMETQQINEVLGRTITSPITDATAMTALPTIAQRANKALMFDASGNPIAGATLPAGTVSSAMQPVINAASLGAGRIALGLGAMAVEGIGAGLQDDGAANARVNFVTSFKSANYVIASTDHLKQFKTSGAITFTLPATASLWDGFGFWVDAYSATLTLTPNAADSIESNTTGYSSYIPAGCKGFVHTNGAGAWSVKRSKTSSAMTTPGGYLSPVTDRAVIFNDAVSTTLYYGPKAHNLIPIYNGAEWIDFPFAELSCPLNATQQTVTQAHDAFVTLVSGAPTLVLGPAWRQAGYGGGAGGFTSATNATPIVITAPLHRLVNGDTVYVAGVKGNDAANGDWIVSGVSGNDFTLTGSVGNGAYTSGTGSFSSRGSGAGTTDLMKVGGLRVNSNQITAYNDVTPYVIPAGMATYVGTVLIGASSGQITCHVSVGQDRMWSVWNAYNKEDIVIMLSDPTASWTYASATFRMSNADSTNVVQTFIGLPEERMHCELTQSGNAYFIGIGYTSAVYTLGLRGEINATYGSSAAKYDPPPTMGAIRVISLERAITGTASFSGTDAYMSLTVRYRG